MVDSAYFVKSTPLSLELLLDLFNTLQIKLCYRHIEDRMKKYDAEKVIFNKMTGFLTSSFSDNCTL